MAENCTPIDVATSETVELVVSSTPSGITLLEVGCGSGEVAARLQQLGYAVSAIDSAATEVRAAQAKGVRARVAEWPHASPLPVEVIMFTRSLHHIKDLPGAVRAAHRTLVGIRRLLIDEFDFVSVDSATVHWLLSKFADAVMRGLVRTDVDEFVCRLAAASNPIAAWHDDHDHDLHGAEAIAHALNTRFTVEINEAVPYLFRYLVPVLWPTEAATTWLRDVLQEERDLGNAGDIVLIGRRFVASAA